MASLLLPVSNLTNLLLPAHVPAARFAGAMALPQLATLAVLWARLPRASAVIVDRPFFLAACGVLVLLVLGYFVGPALGVPVWVTTFVGVLLLGAVGLARRRLVPGTLRHLSLGVFPFVVGLFALVQAVENLGLDRPLVDWLGAPRPAWTGLAAMTGVASLASAALNDLPATSSRRPHAGEWTCHRSRW